MNNLFYKYIPIFGIFLALATLIFCSLVMFMTNDIFNVYDDSVVDKVNITSFVVPSFILALMITFVIKTMDTLNPNTH